WTSAWWHALAWAVFGAAFVAAVVFVASVLAAPAASVLLVLAAGSRLSAYVAATVTEVGFLRGFWMDGSRRLAWLEDYATASAATADRAVPDAIRTAIRLHRRAFGHPRTPRGVLDDGSLTLPAGAVRALVGANGA